MNATGHLGRITQVIVTDFVLRKLDAVAQLSDSDRQALTLTMGELQPVPARHHLIREGYPPVGALVIMTGFACRQKILASGTRQITDYLLPGDWCDPQVGTPWATDYCVSTLSHCLIARISTEALGELYDAHPAIADAVGWFDLISEATLREWLVNIGQRSAEARLAHLFCELLVRLEAVGIAVERTYDFPPTQQDLADTTGLSVVHVNRVLQSLRNAGLIRLKNKRLTILDWQRLKDLANFSPDYLDLGMRKRRRRAQNHSSRGSAPP